MRVRAAMSNARVKPRTAAALVSAIVIASSLAGCTFNAVQTTGKSYDPSDGTSETIGDVKILNTLLITGDGKTANLVMNIANNGVKNAQVQVSWKSSTGRVSRNIAVKADGLVGFGPKGNQIILSGVDAPAGSLFPIFFQYGDQQGRDLNVPVLDGQLAEYTALLPAASK